MTSNINFAAINENFPVAGQDNDTQVFRDNFDTIKTNFSEAKTEITDLQDNAARTDGDNDFLYNVVGSLTLQDAYLRKKDYGAAIVAGIVAGLVLAPPGFHDMADESLHLDHIPGLDGLGQPHAGSRHHSRLRQPPQPPTVTLISRRDTTKAPLPSSATISTSWVCVRRMRPVIAARPESRVK